MAEVRSHCSCRSPGHGQDGIRDERGRARYPASGVAGSGVQSGNAGAKSRFRLLSSVGRINQTNVRTGKLTKEDWPKFRKAVTVLNDKNLYIDDSSGLSPTDMRARARRVAQAHGGSLGLIVVDYLQLMQLRGTTENRVGEISEISGP